MGAKLRKHRFERGPAGNCQLADVPAEAGRQHATWAPLQHEPADIIFACHPGISLRRGSSSLLQSNLSARGLTHVPTRGAPVSPELLPCLPLAPASQEPPPILHASHAHPGYPGYDVAIQQNACRAWPEAGLAGGPYWRTEAVT